LEEFTFGEFQFVKGRGLLFRIKVRLEAFPNGLPMSLVEIFKKIILLAGEDSSGGNQHSRNAFHLLILGILGIFFILAFLVFRFTFCFGY